MSQSPINNNNVTAGTPLYNYAGLTAPVTAPQGQTVSVASNNQGQIYQYPTTSLYEPTKQQASGVNIIICNPSGYSNGNNGAVPYYLPMPQIINNIPQQPAPVVNNNVPAPVVNNEIEATPAAPIANTPISSNEENTENANSKKTKRVTVITDDYIKNLETYLKNPSKQTRQTAISQIIKLFEEDNSRYEDPALTALINIALQDPDASNRIMAMLPLSTGMAHGDANTKKILEQLVNSNKMYGEEAKAAQEALLLVSRETDLVPDDSKK